MSPFPKDVKRPGEIPDLPVLHKIDSFNSTELLLKEVQTKANEQYGDGLVLVCDNEAGTEVKILTFSGVIKEQVENLSGYLPVIIKPVNNGTYYSIF